MGANLVVKFCGKSQILRTKNTCLFEQNFLNTNTESTKNSNVSSQSNKNKRFIERTNQSEYCKYVKLTLLFYTPAFVLHVKGAHQSTQSKWA